MRRKKGTLLPLEVSILQCGIDLAARGAPRFHGFLIAKEIKDREDARLLTAHGTLYKALDRLQKSGFLESDWEDPLLAAREGRPRRRLYHVTAAGEAALADARKTAPQATSQARRPGMAAP
jgi:DNA-binding PadR family transcriptional regulator